jgi:hypothetical protein
MTKDDQTLNMINVEIEKLTAKQLSVEGLSFEDIRRMDVLVRMKQVLISKPTEIYIEKYDNVTDKMILDSIAHHKSQQKQLVKTKQKRAKKEKSGS